MKNGKKKGIRVLFLCGQTKSLRPPGQPESSRQRGAGLKSQPVGTCNEGRRRMGSTARLYYFLAGTGTGDFTTGFPETGLTGLGGLGAAFFKSM